MAGKKNPYTLTVQYSRKKTLKNGKERLDEVAFNYTFAKEIATPDQIRRLDISKEIAAVLDESQKQLKNAGNYEYKHDVLRYEEGISKLAMLFDHDAVLAAVESKVCYEGLLRAMRGLSEDQRRRLYLHYGLGYTYKEIAKKEGVTWQCIRESVKRAKRKIVNNSKKRDP